MKLKRSWWLSLPPVLLMVLAMLGCNIANRWREKKTVAPRRCFLQSTTTSSNNNGATKSDKETAPHEEVPGTNAGYLLISADGGFSVVLPGGFPPPLPPEPMQQGHEYAGVSYYSFREGCFCWLNFTEITAMALSGKSDEDVLADRRALRSEDRKPQARIDREENVRVQGHPALSIYVSGTGVNGRPEYERYKFVIAKGRVRNSVCV